LAQSLDTVVREGSEPVAGELRRVLMEARLGVTLEDAMDSVAERMESEDFHWVVMAIRIQREVGGNLSELLLNVAATLREREFLRRQVKSLSAEGRLSAWIVGGLPVVFVGYLSLVNPGYLAPMFGTPLGWLMSGTACVMMVVGVFWLSKMVKVEV
jgi:tight adherence protein B